MAKSPVATMLDELVSPPKKVQRSKTVSKIQRMLDLLNAPPREESERVDSRVEATDTRITELVKRYSRQPRPKLYWTMTPENYGPHPGNCNCKYCFHVRNCIVREDYDLHDDGLPNCRRLGMRVDTGPPSILVKGNNHHE